MLHRLSFFQPNLSLTAVAAPLLFLALAVLLPLPAAGAPTKCLPPSLKSVLSKIETLYGKVKVISTYRKGAVVALTGRPSRHAKCQAVDFHPAKGSYRAVLHWLKTHHEGGLGTYSGRMHHIHIDDGPKVRFHHAVGGNRKGKRK